MKRHELYDPPEYVAFKPSESVLAEFDRALRKDRRRARIVEGLDRDALLRLYQGLIRFRLHDIGLKRWVRQGVLSKAWLGTGEEAVTIGTVHALRPGDFVGPMIRNAGACHEMGIPLRDMFAAYLATTGTPMRGRDLHIGDLGKGVVAPISHVGALMPVMAGLALGARMLRREAVALTYVGDGATKVGEVHEAMNFAAARRLPLVMVVQMNHVALGTPTEVHGRNDYRDLGKAYGCLELSADGNNVLDTYAAAVLAVAHAREGKGAAILLCETFRIGGHATHDEAEARRVLPAELFRHWGARDPIGVYEHWLQKKKAIGKVRLSAVESEVEDEVERAQEQALAEREQRMPDPATLADGVYAVMASPVTMAADHPVAPGPRSGG